MTDFVLMNADYFKTICTPCDWALLAYVLVRP